MIRPLTKNEFIDIATNGIRINLYNNEINDYIQNLISFINDTSHDYYISDFEDSWCEIAKNGISAIKVSYEKNRIMFYLTDTDMNISADKKSAGTAIKIVHMHSIAWEAINNEGQFNQPIDAWPV